jgi:hypothetical protein
MCRHSTPPAAPFNERANVGEIDSPETIHDGGRKSPRSHVAVRRHVVDSELVYRLGKPDEFDVAVRRDQRQRRDGNLVGFVEVITRHLLVPQAERGSVLRTGDHHLHGADVALEEGCFAVAKVEAPHSVKLLIEPCGGDLFPVAL